MSQGEPQQDDAREPVVEAAPAPVSTARVLSSPRYFLAFGLGSGLSAVAPGTVGTLMAVPLYLLFAQLDLWLYAALVLAALGLGVWLCGSVSRDIGVHDHGGIVWDEFVGYWITMFALPVDVLWIVSGFVVFRIFDIVKPWPVSALDKRVAGGLGIMIDDVVAGIMACMTLHLAILFLPG